MEYENLEERPLTLAERRKLSEKKKNKLLEEGHELNPLEVKPKEKIAKKFWGKLWYQFLTTYEDLDYRLLEGRSLVSANSLLHLVAENTSLSGLVFDEETYKVQIKFQVLRKEQKAFFSSEVTENVSSLLSLLEGKFSKEMCERITNEETGLFPKLEEIHFDCPCMDYADLCKHSAACLIGLAKRFDEKPDLFFQLRGIRPEELLTEKKEQAPVELDEEEASKLFGIDLEG